MFAEQFNKTGDKEGEIDETKNSVKPEKEFKLWCFGHIIMQSAIQEGENRMGSEFQKSFVQIGFKFIGVFIFEHEAIDEHREEFKVYLKEVKKHKDL